MKNNIFNTEFDYFRGDLLTEESNERSHNLDKMSTSELADIFSKEDIEPQRAVAKSLGASQKRLKPILDLVRGQRVEDALNSLSLLPSPWAKSVYKVVASAASNAENNMLMNRDNLKIVHISADNAKSLKRFRPRARGRIGRITKRSSHVMVIVDEDEERS